MAQQMKMISDTARLMIDLLRKGGVRNAERKYKDYCVVSPEGVHDHQGFVQVQADMRAARRCPQQRSDPTSVLIHKRELWKMVGHEEAKRWWSMGCRRNRR